MRRLCLALVIVTMATAVHAAVPFYLGRDGVLWRASAAPEGLLLTAELDGEIQVRSVVPYEIGLAGSFDSNIQVVADESINKVAVVWQRNWSESASEILVAVWSAGSWEQVIHLGTSLASHPRNPAITLTKPSTKFLGLSAPGQPNAINDTYVHVLWWEGVDNQRGMLANLCLSPGIPPAVALDVRELDSLLGVGVYCDSPAPVAVLERPLFASQTAPDKALLFFGSQRTCLFQLIEISFVLQNPFAQPETLPNTVAGRRRHVPVFGVRRVLEAPTAISLDGARMLLSTDLNPVAYRVSGESLEYVIANESGWSPLRTLAVRDGLTLDQAIPLIENLAR